MTSRPARTVTFRAGAALLLCGALGCGGNGDDDAENASGGSATCDDDEVILDGRRFTEARSDAPQVCDAQIMAVYYDDLVGTGAGYNLLLHYDYDASASSFGSFVSINVYGDAPGDYVVDGSSMSGADVAWMLDGAICTAGSGTVTLDTIGDVGGRLTGELDLASLMGSCPATTAGTFSMTIVDADSLMD